MIKNNAYCPWDKTRWSGRNLMQKFHSNTPDNYLEVLQTEYAKLKGSDIVSSPLGKVSHLGSGELRNEYMKQQRIEQERFQAQHAEQLQIDKDLALQIEAAEATERLAQLKAIEEQDRKLAETLAATLQNSRQPMSGQVKRNLIVESLERQRSISNGANTNTEPISRALSVQKTAAAAAGGESVFLSAPREEFELQQTSSSSSSGVRRSLVSSGSFSSSSSSNISNTNKTSSGHYFSGDSSGGSTTKNVFTSIQPSSFYNNNRTTGTKSSHPVRHSSPASRHHSNQSTTSPPVAVTQPVSIFRPNYKRAAVVETSPSQRSAAPVLLLDDDDASDDLTDCEEAVSTSGSAEKRQRGSGNDQKQKGEDPSTGDSEGWCCSACTFLNNRYLTQCELCDHAQSMR
jgi:hypothetical protein